MAHQGHHGNYTNTAFPRKQVKWSWLHVPFFSLSRAPLRLFFGQGTLLAKDIPFVSEYSQYASLDFASPPVIFQGVWTVFAFYCIQKHSVLVYAEVAEHYFAAAVKAQRKWRHLRTHFSDQWYWIINMTDIEPKVKTPRWIPMHSHITASKMEWWAGSQFSSTLQVNKDRKVEGTEKTVHSGWEGTGNLLYMRKRRTVWS